MSLRLLIWNCPLSNHDDGLLERLVKLNILPPKRPSIWKLPIINRRMDKGDFKHYTPLK